MATPANIRAFQITAESYDGGNGNLRTWNIPGSVTAGNPPIIATYSFTDTLDLTAANFPTDAPVGEWLLRNRSPYWFTVTYMVGLGNTLYFHVAPSGLLFLPQGSNIGPDVVAITAGKLGDSTVVPTTQQIEFDSVRWVT